jgi:hypothetical protein
MIGLGVAYVGGITQIYAALAGIMMASNSIVTAARIAALR